MNETAFLEVKGVSKHYGGIIALDNVDFACRRSSIHAILGENGAGKSTLIKVIAGVVRPETGQMKLDGREVSFTIPSDAAREGIFCVFQELSLMPDLTVADNICITNPPRKWGLIDYRAQLHRAEELLARVSCEDINPLIRVSDLPLSRRQMVEIAKALGRNPRLLILDEATSALTAADVEKIFNILKGLRDEGLALLYITHRLREAELLADTCSVFRNGEHVETFSQGHKTPDEIVSLMIGRAVSKTFPPKPQREKPASPAFKAQEAPEERSKSCVTPGQAPAVPMLDIQGLSWENRLHDISFSVRQGEIVGLGGLDGQGQRELLLALLGVLRGVQGVIKIDNRKVRIGSPSEAKSPGYGIVMIPEDRKTEGLLLPMSIRENISLASLDKLSRASVINRKMENAQVQDLVRQLKIKIRTLDDRAGSLSGGNQQKVVVAKWLLLGARCLLLMDPTRGIDVGTKEEMYSLLRRLADQGTAIIFHSTDYDELVGMCDRVIILYRGRIVRELVGDEITEHQIVASSLNLTVDQTGSCQE